MARVTTYASLVVHASNEDSKVIEEILQLKNESRGVNWFVESKCPRTESPETHILELLKVLQERPKSKETLESLGFSMFIFISICILANSQGRNGCMDLSAESVAALAALNVNLKVDICCDCDCP